MTTTSGDSSRPTSSRGPYAKGLAKRAEILRVALEAYAKAGSADPAHTDPALAPAATRPSPAPATRTTDPDRLLREFKKTLGRDS